MRTADTRGRSPRQAGRRPAGAPSRRPHRQLLGLGILVLTIVPAYVVSREGTGNAVVHATDGDANHATDAETDKPQAQIIVDMAAIEAHIQHVAARHRLSSRLVAAIIAVESEFNPRAVSRQGARGLMQLMPATASSLDVRDSFDPFENIEGGVRHLRHLMDRFDGDLPLVLAAYNAGAQAVVEHGGVPPYRETRRYVARVLRRLDRDLGGGVARGGHRVRALPPPARPPIVSGQAIGAPAIVQRIAFVNAPVVAAVETAPVRGVGADQQSP
jgi:hypothetical protein